MALSAISHFSPQGWIFRRVGIWSCQQQKRLGPPQPLCLECKSGQVDQLGTGQVNEQDITPADVRLMVALVTPALVADAVRQVIPETEGDQEAV
jgi:hypothetical protein